MLEPWDGPASIVFTDGRQIGATLDRNGLRPSRYCVTDDDLVIMASESGVLPVPENKIVRKWRLQPGKMFLIDLEQGRMIDDEELKANLANSKPYKQWIENLRIKLDDLSDTLGHEAPHSDVDAARSPAGLRLHPGRHQVPDVARWRRPAKRASARWATTARWPCCRTRTSRCTTTSSSCSRR